MATEPAERLEELLERVLEACDIDGDVEVEEDDETLRANVEGDDLGLLIGVLIGEGHFGGDGKQPQVTLRMHVRHEALFRWLAERFPRSRLYGPYHHGNRHYFQWMVRGRALVEDLLPVLDEALDPAL